MLVTFCGHSQISDHTAVSAALRRVILDLIHEGADEFYLGGYGEFDSLAAAAVRDAKKQYPHIRSTLVIPYMDREYDPAYYDGSVYPPIETVPRRYAISKRNEWMVSQADVVISYITHSWGGAATTLKYASRKKKQIISIVPAADLRPAE